MIYESKTDIDNSDIYGNGVLCCGIPCQNLPFCMDSLYFAPKDIFDNHVIFEVLNADP